MHVHPVHPPWVRPRVPVPLMNTAADVAVDQDPPSTELLDPVPKECGDP
jgi:hypothetical protein